MVVSSSFNLHASCVLVSSIRLYKGTPKAFDNSVATQIQMTGLVDLQTALINLPQLSAVIENGRYWEE